MSGMCFRYVKGEDPAGYLTVDPETGTIATSKILDRESPFVENGVYVVTIYAVEDGTPYYFSNTFITLLSWYSYCTCVFKLGETPLTSTSTLSIHIIDVNDHAPFLNVSTIEMCQSNETSQANITALDLDEEPYVGPFRFKLLEDVGDKWRVEPNHGAHSHSTKPKHSKMSLESKLIKVFLTTKLFFVCVGYSVNLVKENKVYSGHHELLMEVSDLQGMTAVHKLSVMVCDCLDVTQPNCRNTKASRSKLRGEALGIFYFSILLLAGRYKS